MSPNARGKWGAAIPRFHLFFDFHNLPDCASAQWHELYVPSVIPSCTQSTLCAWLKLGSKDAFPEVYNVKMYISVRPAVECQVLGHRHQRNIFISRNFSARCELSKALHSFLQSVALNQDLVWPLFLLQLGVAGAPGSNNFLCVLQQGRWLGGVALMEMWSRDLQIHSGGILHPTVAGGSARRAGPSALCRDSHKSQLLSSRPIIAPWHRTGCNGV